MLVRPVVYSLIFSGFYLLVHSSERPIIGILTQELIHPVGNYTSYISATYVKAIEASGARAAPVFINRTISYYQDLLSKINGIVIPGGMADFNVKQGIAESSAIIFNLTQEMNDNGDYFPILGVCQGFELLAVHSSDHGNPLKRCSALSMNLPLVFDPGFRRTSIFSNVPKEIIRILSTLPVTANYHEFCLTVRNFTDFGLGEKWRILSRNADRKGLEFISSMQMFSYPVVGIQFHPEKNSFEWESRQNNPHSMEAIVSSRIFYDWISRQSRMNYHHFGNTTEELQSLIYQYSPFYTRDKRLIGTQTYFFN